MKKLTTGDIQKLQVSSVDRKDKNFGKQNIFDGCDDTCWTSSEGKSQWIFIELKELHCIQAFNIQFQGGFVGQNCRVELSGEDIETVTEPFYPEDVNSVQKFVISKPIRCKRVKFVFDGSTDFFGRVVVYSVDLFSDL